LDFKDKFAVTAVLYTQSLKQNTLEYNTCALYDVSIMSLCLFE